MEPVTIVKVEGELTSGVIRTLELLTLTGMLDSQCRWNYADGVVSIYFYGVVDKIKAKLIDYVSKRDRWSVEQ